MRRPVKRPDFLSDGCHPAGIGHHTKRIKAPYRVGETVYVKEKWTLHDGDYHPVDGDIGMPIYRADHRTGNDGPDKIKWRHAIRMPEWASRIKLEIVGVRAERLQEITTRDCLAEGCPVPNIKDHAAAALIKNVGIPPKKWFAERWDSICRDKYTWDSNLWVWRIEFKVCKALDNRSE